MQPAPLPSVTDAPAPARARLLRSAWLWWLAAAVLLVVVAIGIERRVTWYLAVDQFGYLTFANDLARGKVLHDWPLLGALRGRLPERIDVLSQTYVYDRGRLYCRYSPGFPLLLAGWLRVFGDNAVHALNPTVFLALLAVALAYQTRVFGDRWRALAGAALIVLCPTFLHLWALTLVRDLPAHLAGVGGLLLLLPNGRPLGAVRAAAAGLALGWAITTRPDAVVYLVPAGLVALWRLWGSGTPLRRAAGRLAAGVLGVAIGVAPLLAYNRIATGSPFRLTQGMEIENLLPASESQAPPPAAEGQVGYAPPAWTGGTRHGVQGGGFRLSHLPTTLPGNLQLLRQAYGDGLLVLAVLGAAFALFQRRALFLTAVPYCVFALLVFSCWSRPDGRYLSGVFVFVPMLVVAGVFGPADALARRGPAGRALGTAAAAGLAALALVPPLAPTGALPVLSRLLPLVAAATTLAAAWARRPVATAVGAPVLAVALVALTAGRALTGEQPRASFQRPQMERARETFAAAVRPGAVVITTEWIGRPAENIDYYSGVAHAVYLTDLVRWRIGVREMAGLVGSIGMTPYLLLPRAHPGRDEMLADLRRAYRIELVADIPPEHNMDYFVAAAFHRGMQLELHRIEVPPPPVRKPRIWLRH